MSPRSLRVCNKPGCPNLVSFGDHYCDEHKRKMVIKKKYPRRYNTNPIYDKDWREIRNRYLANHRICEKCKLRPSVEVHHIKPIQDGGERLNDANLMALCKPCHSKVTLKSTRGFGSSTRFKRVKVPD
jgi:5-methylcytosine-specific restriction protein A